MKKITLYAALLAFVAMPFSFTSCDDDDPWYYDDPYAWRDYYDDWHWNNDYYGDHDSQNDRLIQEASLLCGEWKGPMNYYYIDDNSGQRVMETYYTDMIFYQINNNNKATSGSGVEIDYAYDNKGSVDVNTTQTLKFTWYIDNNEDIYIKYDSGSTYVLDAKSTQRGFELTENVFNGYMIGTNVDDVIEFDFKYVNNQSNAKAYGAVPQLLRPANTKIGLGTGMKVNKGTSSKMIGR